MNKRSKILVAALVVIAVIVLAVVMLQPRSFGKNDVIVLCGGSMRAVLEDAIDPTKRSPTTLSPPPTVVPASYAPKCSR